jgi:hypothetical protein
MVDSTFQQGRALRDFLRGLLDREEPCSGRDVASVTVRIGPVGKRTTIIPANQGANMAIETVRLTADDEFTVTFENVVDADGRPTTFDGPPVWVSSDPAIADVRVADDGLSGRIGSFQADGAALITITADGRQGTDTKPMITLIPVLVGPGDVELFDATVGPVGPRTP